ncbi:RluA family pseudouridine synthase [Anaerosphaera multitolerans]|uniref:Pseudouridine synthase n=1 Tax=Anaerosphaera multitolerans TaxID=2487351 RepID=A0A437S8K9_9FIRM|nr:RluA family pseudouridine synthase [Anaerosphaera multitolerans]RVU55167.1 RluA family pseudouridine synthase [Anaerosphaera multitolerans]
MQIKEILSDAENVRLDKYLVGLLPFNRSQIKKLIDSGEIKVNNKIVKAGYSLMLDDIISVNYFEDNNIPLPEDNIDFKILYEDDDLAVISKPQNLVVHPGAGNPRGTLVNGLLYQFDKLAVTDDEVRPGIVHRLDKDTSGLMIIAKSKYAYTELVKCFKEGKIIKNYLAIVDGNLYEKSTVDTLIGRDPRNRIKMAVVEKNGKRAITEIKTLKNFKNLTLIFVTLHTGRTHQIRVHMNHINHPVLGDPLYGRKNIYGINKQMLHAYTLAFIHPVTKNRMFFKDEFPQRFKSLLKMYY